MRLRLNSNRLKDFGGRIINATAAENNRNKIKTNFIDGSASQGKNWWVRCEKQLEEIVLKNHNKRSHNLYFSLLTIPSRPITTY